MHGRDEDESTARLVEAYRSYVRELDAWAELRRLNNERIPIPLSEQRLSFREEWAFRQLLEIAESLRQEASTPRTGGCPFAQGAPFDGDMARLFVGPANSTKEAASASRTEGLREIRDFTFEASKLVVVDPYAYGGEGATSAKYVDELALAARLESPQMKALHVIYDSTKGNTRAIQDGLATRARDANVHLTDVDTPLVHDRVWIADDVRGLVVGTSFGGVGRRAAFLLDLPPPDFNHFLEFLRKNDLMRGPKRKPPKPATTARARRSRT